MTGTLLAGRRVFALVRGVSDVSMFLCSGLGGEMRNGSEAIDCRHWYGCVSPTMVEDILLLLVMMSR